jgi:hypothetical protein
MPKLGKDDTIKLVDEASTDNGSGYKTIPLKKVYAIAKKAGEIVSDAEDEILDLYMVYSDTDSVPTVKVKEILNRYDLKFSDLKGPAPKFKPSAEFADLFNSSIKEDDFERSSNSVGYGQPEPEMGDEAWEELYDYIRKDKGIEEGDGNPDVNGNKINTEDLRQDVAKFIDKLNLSQFENIIAKIDKPQEKAEIIAAFAEKIGVPRAKLGSVISTIRSLGENKSIIRKDDLIESVKKSNDEQI